MYSAYKLYLKLIVCRTLLSVKTHPFETQGLMFATWRFLELCVLTFIRFIHSAELHSRSLLVLDLKLSSFLTLSVSFICARVGVALIERENNRCDKLESKPRSK